MMAQPPDPLVNLNGALLPAAEARLPVQDHGLLYGLGVFETLRGYDGRLFRLPAHLERLRSGAAVLGIPVPWNDEELARAVLGTLAANALPNAAVRLTVTRGAAPGLPDDPTHSPTPNYFITVRAAPPPSLERFQNGLTAVVASARVHRGNPLTRIKSLNFALQVLARREARERGADEALLLNECDEVVEATVANLFLVRDGTLVTPPPAAGCLPGITRAAVLELARGHGISVVEQAFTPPELLAAEEAFLTNSVLEVMPLVQVEEQPVGTGTPGTVTSRLAGLYPELIARDVGGGK
jgi:branched-chain amino acid aminotransferase